MEVTHWWTSGGEAAAVSVFADAVNASGHEWVDAAIAGGDNARAVILSRIAGGDPMAATQLNTGRDAEDLVQAGLMTDLTELAEAEGWADFIRPSKLRTDLRVEIKRLHQRLSNTMIYVTHDQIEAMTLADRIAIMRDGLIQQLDTPYNIYNNPVNKYVAGFIGSPSMNFLEGSMEGGAKPVFKVGNLSIPLTGYDFTQKVGKGSMDGVTMGVRSEHVLFGELAKKAPFKADVTVEVVEPMGADTLVWSELDGTPFRFWVEGQLQMASGDVVSIGFDPARSSLFDAEDLRI